jgi:type II secretory pathway pseudopilin PulG
MKRDLHQPRGENGETLVELMTAMAILGTAVVALVGGIGTSVVMSDVHRKEATAGAVVRTYGEAIQSEVAGSPTGYVECAASDAKSDPYARPAGFTVPEGFTAVVTAIHYWEPEKGSFVSLCRSDSGIQEVSLSVSSTDVKATETLDVIVRNPCRASDRTCR